MRKLIATLSILLGAIIGIGVFFTNKIMYMKKMEVDVEEEGFQHLPQENFSIPSPYGYELNSRLFPVEQSEKYMILCHGVTVDHRQLLKYVTFFHSLDFHVLLYDHRRHGESGGKTTSYGYYEKYDLQAVIAWLRKMFGEDVTIGLHGESMGAATILQYGGMIADDVDFYIADCSFSTFSGQVTFRLQEEYKLPSWPIVSLANAVLKVRDGYRLQDVSPLEAVKQIQKPVLFVHGQNDEYIPLQHTLDLYEAKQGPKQLYIAERGGHAFSYDENKERYEKAVKQFLAKYVH